MHEHPVDDARALLVLGHGAGGGVTAPDLVLATKAANEAGIGVVLVEQPYRVAGRRSPAPAEQLDAAWVAVVDALRGDVPLLCGGRSSGARVACRTAAETGAAGVLCLAFPVHPPGGRRRPGCPSSTASRSRCSSSRASATRSGCRRTRRPDGRRRRAATTGSRRTARAIAAAISGWLDRTAGATRPPDRSAGPA